MDAKQCMIVDLERRGDKNMFITEQVASIKRVDNGNWIIRFSNSPRIFHMENRLIFMKKGYMLEINV